MWENKTRMEAILKRISELLKRENLITADEQIRFLALLQEEG